MTSMAGTLAYINAHIDGLRGQYICVSNVHTTVMAYERKEYRTIQNSAAMALPDGAPCGISGCAASHGTRPDDRAVQDFPAKRLPAFFLRLDTGDA